MRSLRRHPQRAVLTPVLLLALVVAVGGGATSCVTAATYDDLLLQHERAKRDLVQAQLERDRSAHAATHTSDALTSTREALATATARHAEEARQWGERVARAQAGLKAAADELAATVKDKAGLAASVEQMRSALDELNRRKAEADARVAEYRALLARFRALIDAGKLNVKIIDGRMVVALASDILFPSASAALSKEGRAAIDEVAVVLASIPDRRFQVEGHTDDLPIKTAQFPSNWELAAARALTVTRAMVDAGLPEARVSAASYGAAKPAVTSATPEGRAQNRRIEVVVVPDLSTLPGFDELQKAR